MYHLLPELTNTVYTDVASSNDSEAVVREAVFVEGYPAWLALAAGVDLGVECG